MPFLDDTDLPVDHRLEEEQIGPLEPIPAAPSDPVAPNQTPAPPEPPPVLLTRQQCLDHIDQLKLKLCYIVDGDAYWKSPPGSGVTRVKAEAARISVMTASSLMGNASHIELVDQDTARKIAALKCSARSVIGKQTEDLLKLAPLNPTARAHVLAACGQMPPADADTWEKVRDWVEMNYTPPSVPKGEVTAFVPVMFRQVESGTCSYTAENRVSDDYDAGPHIARQIALNPDWRLSSIITEVRQQILAHAQQELNPRMGEGDTSNYEYEEHQMTNRGPMRVQINASVDRVQATVIEYLRRTQSQQVLHRYGLRPPDPPF